MRNAIGAVLILALATSVTMAADQSTSFDQTINRITSREKEVTANLRQYSPLVETYIQLMRPDKELGVVPAGDRYFLGRADLTGEITLRPLTEKSGKMRRLFGNVGSFFSTSVEFLPSGFLHMIFLDTESFDRQHYKFEYVRREFLGEVRCLVFDVIPLPKSGRGRFLGRIWVEDQDFTIVRSNGGYTGGSGSRLYFHFDSWRVNAGPGLWLPAFIYSEETNLTHGFGQRLRFKSQTRLWGYSLSTAAKEQELSKVLIEAAAPVRDQTVASKDLSSVRAQRAWDRQAEENVVEKMERMGLMGPPGDVEKVLSTVVNNLQVTNNLDIQPEVSCRVLLTSTLESFTAGHTMVLSRGLIDVLPDEASLATMLAHELAHVALGHRIDSQYAFFDQLLFDEKETFRHFGFTRTQVEEDSANEKALELLKNSPYKSQLRNAGLFLRALEARSRDIPNLVSPHLGNRVPVTVGVSEIAAASTTNNPKSAKPIVALPLGSRIKLDPWSDRTDLIKSEPVGSVAEREKMPFEVTPFFPYLTRQSGLKAAARK